MSVIKEMIAKIIFNEASCLTPWNRLDSNTRQFYLNKADSILSAVLEEIDKCKIIPSKEWEMLSAYKQGRLHGHNNAIAEIREILKGVKR